MRNFIFFTLVTLSNLYFGQEIGTEIEGGILIYKEADSKLGLIISKKDLGKMTWEQAQIECSRYNEGEFNNWRLPTLQEFNYIYNYYDEKNYWKENKGMSSEAYWTDNKKSNKIIYAFRFSDHAVVFGKDDSILNVRPVRVVDLTTKSKLNSQNSQDLFRKGLKFYENKDYESAMNMFSESINFDHKNIDSYYYRSILKSDVLKTKKDIDEAEKDLDKILFILGSHNLNTLLTKTLIAKGRLKYLYNKEEACELFRKACSLQNSQGCDLQMDKCK